MKFKKFCIIKLNSISGSEDSLPSVFLQTDDAILSFSESKEDDEFFNDWVKDVDSPFEDVAKGSMYHDHEYGEYSQENEAKVNEILKRLGYESDAV